METNEKVRILIVDDSVFMQRLFARMIVKHPELEIIGTADNGITAISQILTLKPDVVTLDINMPRMTGLEVLDHFGGHPPCPIIVISGFKQSDVELSFQALQKGAFDFILKTSGELSLDLQTIEDDIIMKIKSAGNKSLSGRKRDTARTEASAADTSATTSKIQQNGTKKQLKAGSIIGIGVSTGGPNLLTQLIPQIPADFPVPIVIAQHMPPVYTAEFAKRLDGICKLKVKEAQNGDRVMQGTIYIAPGGFHMEITTGFRVKLTEKEKMSQIYIPSVDILFSSLAKLVRDNCIGLVLTGLGNDGERGVKDIGAAGGIVLIQSPETCVVSGMVKAANSTGFVNKMVTPENLVSTLISLIGFYTPSDPANK